MLVALLLSALATEPIGIHAIFGAFLLGAIIPHDSRVARTSSRKLEDLVMVLLLPAFFAFTGMRTRLGFVSGLSEWLICGADHRRGHAPASSAARCVAARAHRASTGATPRASGS